MISHSNSTPSYATDQCYKTFWGCNLRFAVNKVAPYNFRPSLMFLSVTTDTVPKYFN